MTQATGSNAQIIWGEESTYGTPPLGAGTLFQSATYGESLSGNIEELRSNAISNTRAVQGVKPGNINCAGSIPFELSSLGMGTLFKHLMGGTPITTGTGPYTHSIKRGALPVGLSIEKGFTDITQYDLYLGSRIQSCNISAAPEGLVTGAFEFVSKSHSYSGTSFDATPTELGHGMIAHHEATIVEEGGSAVTLLGLDFNITNNLDTSRRGIGSQTIASLPEGLGEITGTITFLFEDLTYINKWVNGTESEIEVAFGDGSGNTIGFYFPRVVYTGEGAPKIETAQGLVTVLNWRAIYDGVTHLTDCRINLNNGEATI
jgi:hypothetical protein